MPKQRYNGGMKTTTIYWSGRHPFSSPMMNWNMVYDDPKPVMSTMPKHTDRGSEMLRCPAFTGQLSNVFAMTSPLNLSYSIVNNEVVRDNEQALLAKLQHERAVEGNNLLSLDMSFYFFSEDDIEMTWQAPYFSPSPHLQYGSIVPGTFNISKWFRPANPEFNLWAGVEKFKLAEGEVFAYVSFHTDSRITFKRFNFTQELLNVAAVCSAGAGWEPRVPLLKRYDRFTRTKTHKLVLDLIKDNVIE